MKTKLLTILLCLALVLGMTACGASGAPESAPAAPETQESAAEPEVAESAAAPAAEEPVAEIPEVEETEDTLADAPELPEFPEHLTISHANSIRFGEGFDFNEGTEYHKWWADKFNISWDITLLEGMGTDQITTWINAEDLPDLTAWIFNTPELVNYADQGLLYRWPDDWKEKYPYLARLYQYSSANTHYENLLGGTYIYAIPVFTENFPAEHVTEHSSLWIRRSYAENAGVDLTKYEESHTITISEFTDLLQKIKDKGEVDYPMYMMPFALPAYIRLLTDHSGFNDTVPAFYVGDDGLYHWGPAEEETHIKETIRTIRDQYQKGLIDQDFYNCWDDSAYIFSTGQGAVAFSNTTVSGVMGNGLTAQRDLGLDMEKDYVCLILTDDEGVAHQSVSLNYFRGLILRPDIEEEKAERIFTMLNYLASPEATRITNMGLEGVDWEMGEDGDLVSLLPEGENALDKYVTLHPYSGMVQATDDFAFVDPSNSDFAKDLVSELYRIRSDISNLEGQEYDWNIASYSSPAMTQATMVYQDEYIRLILAEGDFDQIYQQWLDEKMPVIQAVLDELNSGR